PRSFNEAERPPRRPIKPRETEHEQTLDHRAVFLLAGMVAEHGGQRSRRPGAHHLQPELLRCPRVSAARTDQRRKPCELCWNYVASGTRFCDPARPYRSPIADPRAELPE